MPYISPSLSPTRSFISPAQSVLGGSGTSSPAEPASPVLSTRYNTSSNSLNSYQGDGYSLGGQDAGPSSVASKRPPHRHHSRSHSSDTLVTLGHQQHQNQHHQHQYQHLYPQHQHQHYAASTPSSNASYPHRHARSSKMTPDFIYVQPASPGVDEQPTSSNMSHYNSLPTSGSSSGRSHSYTGTSPSSSTSSRPGLRRSSASARQSAAAVFGDYAAQYGSSSTSPTSTAGDYGDVPPPRSSSSSSLSSQARRSRRQMSASADSSPRHSISYHTPLPRIQDDESAVAGSPPVTPVNSTFEHDHPENAGSVSNGRRSTTTAASSSSPKQTRAGLPRIKSVSMQPSFSDSALATSSSSATSSINNTSDDDSDNSSKATAKAVLSSPLLQKHKPSWGEIPGAASSTLLGGNLSTAFQFGQALPNTPNGDHYLQAGSGAGGSSSGSSTPTPKAEKAEDAAIAGAHSQINGAIPGNNDLQLVNGELGDRPDWTPASSSSTTQPSTNTSVGSSLASSGAGSSTNDNQNGAGSGSGSGSATTSSESSESSPSSTPASSAGLTSTTTPSGASSTPTSGPLAPAAVKLRRPTHTKAFSERAESPFRLEFEANNHHNQSSTHPSTHSRMTGLRQRESSEGSNIVPPAGSSSTSGSSTTSAHLGQYNHGGLTVHTHHPLHHFQQLHSGSSRSGSHRPSPLPTPMLRKKSGELVKSSMKHDSKAKSAPTTPTGPKAVHFDEQLERVKLFLAQQKPTAVSRDGSPQETETEDDSEATAFPFPPMTTSIPAQITLVLPDFPKNMLPDLGSRDVCLESLEIAADSRSLKGAALLRNIAFEKRLSIRFTFDDWQTVSEVTGEWQATLSGGNIDRWIFRIKLDDMLARIEDKKLYLALRYTVGGRDIWDSNGGANYRAEFKKQAARSQAVVGGSRAARHEWSVTNAGQANERMADLRRELDRLVAGHEDDDFSSADELVISSNSGGKGFKYQHRFLGGESVPLAQAPASNTFSSRYDFGASLKQASGGGGGNASASNPALSFAPAQHRNSPQTSHAVLDNPYFAAPNASEAMISSWRNAANVITQSGHHNLAPAPSPMPESAPMAPSSSLDNVSPKSQHQSLYADDIAPLLTTTVIGGMPATTFVGAEPSASTPPASFSGSDYYPRTENNGVISQDFGLPNFMSYMKLGANDPTNGSSSATSSPRTEVPSSASSTPSTAIPGSYFPAGDPISSASSSTSNSASNSTTPSIEHSPTADFSGGAPLARQNRFNSFPPTRSFIMNEEGSISPGTFRPSIKGYPSFEQGDSSRPSVLMHGNRQHSASSLSDILDGSLMDSAMDPRDTSIYSPAISPRSGSPPISSSAEIPGAHQRRHSPPPRPISPDDLLSPSPSSASTDTSISTPQSPGGSPPLRMYSPFIASGNGNGGRPEMGSDTYFNFVHRYCWGNGDTASSSSSSSSTSTALGLAGLNPTAFEVPTPRHATPPSSCSVSLLSSPTQSQSGSRTPSPKNGSPSLETVQRMEAKGYMNGPPIVQI